MNKIPFSEVKSAFEKEGYMVVTDESNYVNTNTKIHTLCPKKHKHDISYGKFKYSKRRCPKCLNINNRKTKQYLCGKIEERGYKYVSGEYIVLQSVIEMECKKHGNFKKRFGNFMQGQGCQKCTRDKLKVTKKEMIKHIENTGFKYVSGEYVTHKSMIIMDCEKHGLFSKKIGSVIKMKVGCQECGFETKAIKTKIKYETIIDIAKKDGYVINTSKSEYEAYGSDIEVTCNDGHVYTVLGSDFKRGNRCPKCSNHFSKPEQELLEWVQLFYPSARKYKFKELGIDNSRREIDIYVPELKLGIEFCGLYWHSEKVWKSKEMDLVDFKKKHINKFLDTEKAGIHLITIFSDEWEERRFQLKSFLKAKLGVCKRRFYGRKCELKEITWPIARDFLNDYHIQGKPSSSKYSLGLFSEDELLAVMTSAGHHRQGFDSVFVLNRLAYKDDVYIIGGASKLNKALLRYVKENNYGSLISWSDNRISKGTVYENLGYNKIQDVSYDYSYVDGVTRQSKQSNKKKSLIKKGADGTMDNTERELAITLNLWRIWDCGKRKWEIKTK